MSDAKNKKMYLRAGARVSKAVREKRLATYLGFLYEPDDPITVGDCKRLKQYLPLPRAALVHGTSQEYMRRWMTTVLVWASWQSGKELNYDWVGATQLANYFFGKQSEKDDWQKEHWQCDMSVPLLVIELVGDLNNKEEENVLQHTVVMRSRERGLHTFVLDSQQEYSGGGKLGRTIKGVGGDNLVLAEPVRSSGRDPLMPI